MTDTQNEHPLMTRYLKDLERALRDLPAARRAEIMEDTGARIADAAADGGEWMTESELRSLLNQVGHPEAIAQEARERFGVRRKRGGAMEVIAIAGLLIGGLVFPAIGWVLGVILLWMSSVWSVRDKILGTLVVPGGLLAPLLFSVYAVGASACLGGPGCTGESEVVFPGAALIVVAAMTLGPMAVAIYLGRKAFRRP